MVIQPNARNSAGDSCAGSGGDAARMGQSARGACATGAHLLSDGTGDPIEFDWTVDVAANQYSSQPIGGLVLFP